MEREAVLATLSTIVNGAMTTLAGLAEFMMEHPEEAKEWAEQALVKDANYPEPKPEISLAWVGAALYVHKLAELALAEKETAQEWPEFPGWSVPPSSLPN